MPKLLINPGSAAAREILLKEGSNSFGRGSTNDVKLEDPSVSGTHCQILVDHGQVIIKDLGSTNGTFVNRTPVKETTLQGGQTVHLGGVEMLFYSDAPAYSVAKPVARLVTRTETEAPPAVEATTHAAPPMAPRVATPSAPGSQNCKSHPKTPGRYFCSHCQKYFCELCVMSRTTGGTPHKTCRHCGTECTPVQVNIARRSAAKGFFARIPGVFVYPFRGTGLMVLIAGTLVFAGLQFMGMGWGILIKILAIGYLFSYMQSIIHSTAAEDQDMPELPAFDGLFGAFFTLVGTISFCFALPIALGVAKFYYEVDIPTSALVATLILSALYFPMAFLAVAMKDTVMAANPLVVIPSILKVPLEYFVAAILLAGVFGLRAMGDFVVEIAKGAGYFTEDMTLLLVTFGIRAFWSFASVYLLTIGMRILGLLYLTKKDKLGWFSH